MSQGLPVVIYRSRQKNVIIGVRGRRYWLIPPSDKEVLQEAPVVFSVTQEEAEAMGIPPLENGCMLVVALVVRPKGDSDGNGEVE